MAKAKNPEKAAKAREKKDRKALESAIKSSSTKFLDAKLNYEVVKGYKPASVLRPPPPAPSKNSKAPPKAPQKKDGKKIPKDESAEALKDPVLTNVNIASKINVLLSHIAEATATDVEREPPAALGKTIAGFLKVVELCDAALADFPGNISAIILRAHCRRDMLALDDAVVGYSEALQLISDINTSPAMQLLNTNVGTSKACQATNAVVASITDLLPIQKLDALEGRALCYQLQQRYNEAMADNTAIIALDELNDNAYNRRACCLLAKRAKGVVLPIANFEKVVADLKMAIKLNPNSYSAWVNLGKAYEEQQMPKNAVEAYTASLKINNGYRNAKYRRACAAQQAAAQMEPEITDLKRRIEQQAERLEASERHAAADLSLSSICKDDSPWGPMPLDFDHYSCSAGTSSAAPGESAAPQPGQEAARKAREIDKINQSTVGQLDLSPAVHKEEINLPTTVIVRFVVPKKDRKFVRTRVPLFSSSVRAPSAAESTKSRPQSASDPGKNTEAVLPELTAEVEAVLDLQDELEALQVSQRRWYETAIMDWQELLPTPEAKKKEVNAVIHLANCYVEIGDRNKAIEELMFVREFLVNELNQNSCGSVNNHSLVFTNAATSEHLEILGGDMSNAKNMLGVLITGAAVLDRDLLLHAVDARLAAIREEQTAQKELSFCDDENVEPTQDLVEA